MTGILRTPGILALILAAACSNKGDNKSDSESASKQPARTEGRAKPPAAPESSWSENLGGLRLRVVVPRNPQKIGDEVPVALLFRNETQKPIRVYLINSEAFRSGQSSLRAMDADDDRILAVQPEPRPHGYEVTEKDFHMLAPGEAEFSQTLTLDKKSFEGVKRVQVEWIYENQITEWKGGVQTADGVTKRLFNGLPIPLIWTGELRASALLNLE
jgi:hypothetical protein